MRIALEVPAVLERARLAFVDVHGHHARLGLGGDDAPLAPRREAGPAEAAQARVLHHLGNGIARVLASEAIGEQSVAAVLAVLRIADVRLDRAAQRLFAHRRSHRIGARVAGRVLAHHDARRDFAAADARRWDHAYARPEI